MPLSPAERIQALLADPDYQALSEPEKVARLAALTEVPPTPAEPPAAAEAPEEAPGDPSDYAELGDFLDDTLRLSYQGQHYDLPAADITTGLECQLVLGVAISGRMLKSLTQTQKDRLDDADERELFQRLLGGQQWLTEPTDDTPGVPNPRYDPTRDIWQRLTDEGRSWTFVQHMGATAMYWAAVSRQFALEYWLSGGTARPKAPTSPSPRPPQDRRPRTTTPTSGRKKRRKGGAPGGAKSSGTGG